MKDSELLELVARSLPAVGDACQRVPWDHDLHNAERDLRDVARELRSRLAEKTERRK